MIFRMITALASIILAACGGGGGGSGGSPSAALSTVLEQPLFIPPGVQRPTNTAATELARAEGILARSDSLLVSNLHSSVDGDYLPELVAVSLCSGGTCTWTHEGEHVETLTGREISADPDGVRALLSKYGITTLVGRQGDSSLAYSAWMNHSAFGIQIGADTAAAEGGMSRDVVFAFGLAGGDLTGTRPAGTATWRGLAVGTLYDDRLGDTLQGDATLTFTVGTNSLAAVFDNFENLTRQTKYDGFQIRFDGIPVSAQGTFRSSSGGGSIQGGFYGPGHAETAGTFEKSTVVGAFGAKR